MDFKLQQFSGPLDLLLSLIEENKMTINEISLSSVTEQYVSFVENLDEEKISTEDLADFLMIAAKLILLKAKSLIPTSIDEEENGASLEDQLRLYKAFIEAAKKIQKQWLGPEFSAFHLEPPRKSEFFVKPNNFSLENLQGSMLQLIRRLTPARTLQKTTIDGAITLEQKIVHLKDLVKKGKKILFHKTLNQAQNKTEIIVSFLALLELIKQQEVSFSQKDLYGDITIVPN